ncbi:MAG: CopG family transcriptional regulator [Deltaproteobacteria bacterium]|nr:CopG family transcriptional regulator [Deltaproteobacteria bacterium]
MSRKPVTLTFKVDPALAEILDKVPNKSEFVRRAVLSALENTCPLCSGTGILTPRQRDHWATLARTHFMAKCGDCQEYHLVCHAGDSPDHSHGMDLESHLK